jgi:peptidyl-prolyl cis-trans isomerase D
LTIFLDETDTPMLRGIHTATRNWLGRVITGVLLGLIAISFAVWGIGDIFRGFGQSTVAKIGKTDITIEQFRSLYTERQQQLSRQLGRALTPDQIRALGLHRQLLAQVVAETALDEDARNLRLAASDAEVAQRIRSDANFRGITGQFDQARFQALIRQAGFTEQRYVAEQRKLILRRQIAEALSGGLRAPATSVDILYRYQNEERAIQYVLIDARQAGEIDTPIPEVISKYFEERKAAFRAPEYRKIEYILLTSEEIAKWTQISDADVKKAYDERREKYATPERRELQQIVFPSAADAEIAAKQLADGKTFAQIAAERKISENDLNLGRLTKSAILDRAVADAAFSLPEGGVSGPIAGRFGHSLVRVVKIEPGHQRTFDEVSGELRRDLALERARTEMASMHDKLEDERGAGASLSDIAKKLNLQTRVIEAVDRSGRDPAGQQVAAMPQGVDLLGSAFSADVGSENDALSVPGGGYLWYEVLNVTPSRERSFDEVRDRVLERWRNEQIATRVRAQAVELADKLKTGGNEEATLGKFKWQTAAGLKRNKPAGNVPVRALPEIFALPKGGVSSSEGDEPTQWMVFRLTDISVPKLDSQSTEAKQIQDNLRTAYAEDLIAQYVGRLQTELGATINEAALNQAVGITAN